MIEIRDIKSWFFDPKITSFTLKEEVLNNLYLEPVNDKHMNLFVYYYETVNKSLKKIKYIRIKKIFLDNIRQSFEKQNDNFCKQIEEYGIHVKRFRQCVSSFYIDVLCQGNKPEKLYYEIQKLLNEIDVLSSVTYEIHENLLKLTKQILVLNLSVLSFITVGELYSEVSTENIETVGRLFEKDAFDKKLSEFEIELESIYKNWFYIEEEIRFSNHKIEEVVQETESSYNNIQREIKTALKNIIIRAVNDIVKATHHNNTISDFFIQQINKYDFNSNQGILSNFSEIFDPKTSEKSMFSTFKTPILSFNIETEALVEFVKTV
ncbi:hypothetical protein CDIK_1212 [Cucumispora dikerogammari]|nr:hypothetical protein CDIK_1212 [Cucumispora dikerogammari]